MGIRFDIDPVAQMEASSLLASWLQLPTETLQESVSDGSFVASVAALAEALEESQGAVEGDGSWQDALDAVRSGQPSSLEDLRRDYTRLFTHPRQPLIPPYESQYRYALAGKTDRPLLAVNRTATALDEFYHQWGYRVDRTHAVSADHMAVELTFLAQLWGGLQRERDEEGPQEAAVQDALRQFVEEHVGFWAPGFFRDVAREAATPEYRLVGQFGQRLFPSAS